MWAAVAAAVVTSHFNNAVEMKWRARARAITWGRLSACDRTPPHEHTFILLHIIIIFTKIYAPPLHSSLVQVQGTSALNLSAVKRKLILSRHKHTHARASPLKYRQTHTHALGHLLFCSFSRLFLNFPRTHAIVHFICVRALPQTFSGEWGDPPVLYCVFIWQLATAAGYTRELHGSSSSSSSGTITHAHTIRVRSFNDTVFQINRSASLSLSLSLSLFLCVCVCAWTFPHSSSSPPPYYLYTQLRCVATPGLVQLRARAFSASVWCVWISRILFAQQQRPLGATHSLSLCVCSFSPNWFWIALHKKVTSFLQWRWSDLWWPHTHTSVPVLHANTSVFTESSDWVATTARVAMLALFIS